MIDHALSASSAPANAFYWLAWNINVQRLAPQNLRQLLLHVKASAILG